MVGKIMICSDSQYEESLQRTLADVSDSVCTGGHWESKTVGRGVVRRTWEIGKGDVVYWTWDGQGVDEPCSDRVCLDGQCHYWLRINEDGHKEAIERWGQETTLEYATPWHWLLAKVKDAIGRRVAQVATMATSTAPMVQDCPLMRLPAELRDYIYELAVVELEAITTSSHSYREVGPAPPALARTCRQLFTEVLQVYYKQNHFQIRISPAHYAHYKHGVPVVLRRAHTWLSQMSAAHRALVGGLIICSYGGWGEDYHQGVFKDVTCDSEPLCDDGVVLWKWGGVCDDEFCRGGYKSDYYCQELSHFWIKIEA
ncbi:hypothetical protein LTR56_016714 [Elasticomyces elasticus]|nr:hypothetical protein LTR56_016714 [Elasticomyces elasticus]KAK3663108.1 hypothetical protein LTR22_006017 [Elasticomyces elasticus]KAK4905671.1 hypothetical protein LTR49_025060 [Elasticomyces elasticus]KAK5750626.1 hypothetical protein LTS12_019333 [Elasticomyces elasticus]